MIVFIPFMLNNHAYKIDINAHSPFYRNTALHRCARIGNEDLVRFLIENGADVNAVDRDGWTPMHCLLMGDCFNTKVCKYLFLSGAVLPKSPSV
eukprot:UN23821